MFSLLTPLMLEDIVITGINSAKQGKLVNIKFDNFCLYLDLKSENKNAEEKIKRVYIPYPFKLVANDSEILFSYDVQYFNLISPEIKSKYPIPPNNEFLNSTITVKRLITT